MLSLRELHRAAGIIKNSLACATLRRVSQPGEQKLVLTFERAGAKTHLLLSCHPEHAYLSSTPATESSHPGSFQEYARAHLVGAILSEIEVSDANRQLGFRFDTRSDGFVLLFSIFGVRSNIYLLDAQRKLVHALRPLEDTRRELALGAPWIDPEGTAPSEGNDRWPETPDSAYLGAIRETYEALERRHAAELLARRIEQALRRERTFLERKATNLQEDLGAAHESETHRRKGELLKSALHLVNPGDRKVTATDYATGESVEIPIDPKLSPAANLEAYFARYQKEARGVGMIEQQIGEVEAARSILDGIEQQVKAAVQGERPDVDALEELASRPDVRRLISRHGPKRKTPAPPVKKAEKRDVPSRLVPKRYRTRDGLEIWVGKNDEGNDYLTTRLARGNDLFFHLEGYPGSHVVLRTEGRTDPPQESLLDACELAVHFSKMKNAGSADVHLAPIKNVKKPKGAKPGLVYVRSGRTVHLRRDPKRLQSILASRLDE